MSLAAKVMGVALSRSAVVNLSRAAAFSGRALDELQSVGACTAGSASRDSTSIRASRGQGRDRRGLERLTTGGSDGAGGDERLELRVNT